MENSKKAYKNPIRAAIASLLIGMVMRILHWPFSKGIIFISFAAILILYALRFFKKEEKKSVDLIKMALVLFWTTNGLLTILDFTHTLFFKLAQLLHLLLGSPWRARRILCQKKVTQKIA